MPDPLPMTRRGVIQSALAAVPEAPPQLVRLNVNGKACALRIAPRVTLLDALRDYLGLADHRLRCDHGQCGGCPVLLDGRRVHACLTLAVMAEGRHVTTMEGLACRGRPGRRAEILPVLNASIAPKWGLPASTEM